MLAYDRYAVDAMDYYMYFDLDHDKRQVTENINYARPYQFIGGLDFSPVSVKLGVYRLDEDTADSRLVVNPKPWYYSGSPSTQQWYSTVKWTSSVTLTIPTPQKWLASPANTYLELALTLEMAGAVGGSLSATKDPIDWSHIFETVEVVKDEIVVAADVKWVLHVRGKVNKGDLTFTHSLHFADTRWEQGTLVGEVRASAIRTAQLVHFVNSG